MELITSDLELKLPSLELELNCLKDFVPDSELNWNCYYRNWNCKNGIDPGSAVYHEIRLHVARSYTSSADSPL